MQHRESLIIGAGPAGLQLAHLLGHSKRDYLILEAAEQAGTFFSTYPRHRQLLSLNKRFNGFPELEFNMRHDWNSLLVVDEVQDEEPRFIEYSEQLYPHADDLQRYIAEYAARHELRIRYGCRVARIEAAPADAEANFLVHDSAGNRWSCTRLFVATGACAPYRPPEIEGLELAESYERHELDPRSYQNQRVLVIGRNNSAFEVANHLAGHAAILHVAIGNRPVDLAWSTHSVRNVRAVNNTIMEMFHLKALHGALGLTVKQIREAPGGGFEVRAEEEVPHWREPGMLELDLHYDRVICCTGFRFVPLQLFDESVRPAVDEFAKYPVLDPCWGSSVPNLYFIGTSMAARDKRAASSFIHGFRYNIRTLHHLLEQRDHAVPYPSQRLPLSEVEHLRELALTLLERLSLSAGLYQQWGLLCDLLRFEDESCELMRELPRAHVEQELLRPGTKLMTMSFEYGFERYPAGTDPLSFITQSDEASSRRCAAYLHPVFRYYEDGELRFEDNLGESLTLRYGPYRSHSAGGERPEGGDVEHLTLMNILNRAVGLSKERWSETQLLADHGFRPWPAERPLEREHMPRCPASDN